MIDSRLPVAALLCSSVLQAATITGWKVLPPTDERTALPGQIPPEARDAAPGDPWPQDRQFRWMLCQTTVPETIDVDGRTVPTRGEPVGMRFDCGDGGEIYVNGRLQTRYDNDHPGLVLVAEDAVPGTPVRLAVQVYGYVQGGDRFGQAEWTVIDRARATAALQLSIDAASPGSQVPAGLIGLSQGGGLADYEEATAARLVEAGFRWFRMDNVLTGVLTRDQAGADVYDWTDFDRRLDFIVRKMKAEPILAASYMPIVLDAVENHERQSAPADYGAWEELCYRAARRALERGVRVPWWEVWNEVNAGWLKPGPQDTGGEPWLSLYRQAVGREDVDPETVRRFEAYCKLYRATARGVKRADPDARIGGPALASGPFEQHEYGFCTNGRGFARGLMAWCQQENLPLDFVSWHEYFHPAAIIAREADAFRAYLEDFPALKRTVRSFMLTEWNEAWWPNRPQDHEIGAAWCADCVVRAFVPHGIDRPCFFYVKQNDMNFRGDYSLLMAGNVPKAAYNMAKVFNGLSGRYLALAGGDDDVCGLAAWDAGRGRLAVVLVNFRDRYALRRKVRLTVAALPDSLQDGAWRRYVIDAAHSNVWHSRDRAELEQTASGRLSGPRAQFDLVLEAHSITLIELLASDRPHAPQ